MPLPFSPDGLYLSVSECSSSCNSFICFFDTVSVASILYLPTTMPSVLQLAAGQLHKCYTHALGYNKEHLKDGPSIDAFGTVWLSDWLPG